MHQKFTIEVGCAGDWLDSQPATEGTVVTDGVFTESIITANSFSIVCEVIVLVNSKG